MWTIRSRIYLVKLPSAQCPTQLVTCQRRQLTSGIVDHIHPNDVKVESNNNNNNKGTSNTNSNDSGTNGNSTPSPSYAQQFFEIAKKGKERKKGKGRHQKRQLLRTLQQRVGKHIAKSSVLQSAHTVTNQDASSVVQTVDETKADLDDTWTELDSTSTYQRVYPETVIPVATLAHGLERTLFKPGVHPLIDSKANKHLFPPYLESITQPDEFDYDAVKPYVTSSKDKNLIEMAKEQKARFVGSTSSLSGVLSHLYFKISNHRPVDMSFLTHTFAHQPNQHTRGSRVPKTILLRWKDGVYGVDADKSFDTGDTVLSHLGKSMEKVLTMELDDYERYLKKNSSTSVTEEERNAPEAFAYGRIGDLFLRSQLDCYHRNLPRRTFDLKTRATMPVRLDIPHYQDYYNYQLEQNHGLHYSFEREYYDMMRSAFLKYSFQVRIGHMDGIMVTYHNTEKVFGFQYIPRNEMDARIFGTSKMGDEVFRHCLDLMQTIFDKATTQFPKKTLRMTFDASRQTYKDMRVYIEPVTEEQEKRMDDDDNNKNPTPITLDQTAITDSVYNPLSDHVTMYRLNTTSYLNGKKIIGPVSVNKESDVWDLCYKLEEEESIPKDDIATLFRGVRYEQATVFLPKSDESPKFLHRFKLKRGEYRKGNNSDNDGEDRKGDNNDGEDQKGTDNEVLPEYHVADGTDAVDGPDAHKGHKGLSSTTTSTSTTTSGQ